MKTLKVYDDAHQSIKIEAAKSGRTTTETASLLIREAVELVKKGKISLAKPAVEGGE